VFPPGDRSELFGAAVKYRHFWRAQPGFPSHYTTLELRPRQIAGRDFASRPTRRGYRATVFRVGRSISRVFSTHFNRHTNCNSLRRRSSLLGQAAENASRRKVMTQMVQFATLLVATVLAVGTAVSLNWILLRVAFQLMQPAAARRAAPEQPRWDLSRGTAQVARAYVAQR
jgi:hypothetical protein